MRHTAVNYTAVIGAKQLNHSAFYLLHGEGKGIQLYRPDYYYKEVMTSPWFSRCLSFFVQL